MEPKIDKQASGHVSGSLSDCKHSEFSLMAGNLHIPLTHNNKGNRLLISFYGGLDYRSYINMFIWLVMAGAGALRGGVYL